MSVPPKTSQPSTQTGEDIETYLADMANMVTRGGQVVAAAQTQALQQVVVELEQVLQFMRVGCQAAFATCFESQGWPTTKTEEMLQAWRLRQPVVESRVTAVVCEIEQVYQDAYCTLRRTQQESAVREAARVALEIEVAS